MKILTSFCLFLVIIFSISSDALARHSRTRCSYNRGYTQTRHHNRARYYYKNSTVQVRQRNNNYNQQLQRNRTYANQLFLNSTTSNYNSLSGSFR